MASNRSIRPTREDDLASLIELGRRSWVHPGWQGTGAGTLLLKTGEEAIRQAGYRTAWLTCSGFNTNALGFYQKQGYGETRRDRELHPSGVEVENVRMERPLDRDGT